jgi:hypothetical protein
MIHIKSQKLILLLLFSFAAFLFSASVLASNNQFKPAPKERLAEFYEAQFQRFYDSIPLEISRKHAATIAKVDKKITSENMTGAITSKTKNFDLDYYAHVIKVGIIPYADKNFEKELQGLIDDIDKYTIDWERLKENNRVMSGGETPIPATTGKSTAAYDVRISLNGSGYNVTNAVNYARTWTQNGTELRNPSYNYFAGMNDCTNFVSQVLHDSSAGKIPYVHIDTPWYDYDDLDNWYYEKGWLWYQRPSNTWGGAHNLYWHLKNYSSNVRRLYYWSDVRVGDIVQWDMEPYDGKFHIGHSTVVTKIQNGVIYLTYHSIDKEDEPITTFTNKGYLGYPWAINH